MPYATQVSNNCLQCVFFPRLHRPFFPHEPTTYLKTAIMMLEKKIESRKQTYGVEAYKVKEQLQHEYDLFVDELRRSESYLDEREMEDRIAEYMVEMERDEEFRVQKLYDKAESDVDVLLARIRRKEDEISRIEAAEAGEFYTPVDRIADDDSRYEADRRYVRDLQKNAKRKLRYDRRSSSSDGDSNYRLQNDRTRDVVGRDPYEYNNGYANDFERRYSRESQYDGEYSSTQRRLLPPPRPSVDEFRQPFSEAAVAYPREREGTGQYRSNDRYGNSVSEWS